ncbi:MAG: hypothetical protein ACERLG_02100 [Sedimentibacter sp.]
MQIGGNEEELAAEYIKKNGSKPVIPMIAGKDALKGRIMGHRSAIVFADGTGSVANKEKLLAVKVIYIAESTVNIGDILKRIF